MLPSVIRVEFCDFGSMSPLAKLRSLRGIHLQFVSLLETCYSWLELITPAMQCRCILIVLRKLNLAA